VHRPASTSEFREPLSAGFYSFDYPLFLRGELCWSEALLQSAHSPMDNLHRVTRTGVLKTGTAAKAPYCSTGSNALSLTAEDRVGASARSTSTEPLDCYGTKSETVEALSIVVPDISGD
jgi:hypothetical protein